MLSPSAQARLVRFARAVVTKKTNCDNNGVSSRFYRISENFGLKVCSDNDKTTYGYMSDVFNKQLQANHLGLAPYCFGFGKYDYVDYCNDPTWGYGYITEIVSIHKDVNGNLYYQEEMTEEPQIKHMQRIFQTKLNPSFKFEDCHNENVGIRGRNKKMLCIDFGDD